MFQTDLDLHSCGDDLAFLLDAVRTVDSSNDMHLIYRDTQNTTTLPFFLT
jgi:hypothetical protein